MGHFTAFITEIGLDDLGQAGGKGANLGHLMRAGFPVPPGFCVLVRAYDILLETPGLRDRMVAILESTDFGDAAAVESAVAGIGELIVSTPIPGPIAREITTAYQELMEETGGEALVAVRSSVGTKDLASTSFPGQMDTYHNLRREEEVINKVRECWASAFSYPAVVNRHARGIGHFDVFVAPLVQLMVDSDSAGVIFTVNPSNNRPDQMVINACFGLGEGVVSGELECDHLVVDKDSGKVLEEEIGDKEFKIVLNARQGSGNLKVPLPEDERSRASLSAEQVSELVGMAREIEKRYGHPQDIEWAFHDDKLYILQSRRITALGDVERAGEEAAEEWVSEFDSTVDPDYDYYTLSNISEVLPGVLTPLTMSDINSLDYGFLKTNTDFGLMKGIDPKSELTFLGLFYGRAHLNLSVFKAMVSKVPGGNAKEFERAAPEEGEEKLWRPTMRNIIALPGIFARMIYKAMVTPWKAKAIARIFDERISREKWMNLENMPYDRIFAWMEDGKGYGDHAMVLHITASQFAFTFYDSLCKITERLLGDTHGILASRLVTGLQDLESARPSALIWDLSRLVKDSPELSGIFEGNEPSAILDLLEGSRSAEARKFLESFRSFLDEFGYRGVFEAEIMLPNWEDDPGYVFAMIKNYLDADPGSNPHDLSLRQKREREEAVCEAIDGLKGSQRLLLRFTLKQAQKYIAMREFMKAILIKGITQFKRVYHILSHRFAADRIIKDPEDIFFLTSSEIKALATGEGKDIPVEELVARRRREYERNQTVVLPEYSRGRPKPLSPQELELKEDIEVLSGIAVSPGKVTGRARVITNPRRDAKIEKGEILVAPVTDAAWTPLFVTAKAIVVDVGGPLSHGSIVAREFGIPCVLNVGVASRIIKTGQIITVDGTQGKVYLHPSKGQQV